MSKSEKAAKVSQNEARRRKEVALAEMRELERDQLKGKLVERASVKRFWSGRLAAFRDATLSLPDALAPRLAGRGEAEIRNTLRDALEQTLRNLHHAE